MSFDNISLQHELSQLADRDKRVQDNWAMLHGQKLAMAAKAPFAVATALPEEQVLIDSDMSHNHFKIVLTHS